MRSFRRKSSRASGPEPKPTFKERMRRRLVFVIFIIYYLLIFEGALRKWVMPSAHKILFFIRDPFVLYCYYLAFRYGMWPRWTPLMTYGCGIGVFFILLAMFQSAVTGLNPLIGIVGWRGYFWYVPLVFIIGSTFKGKDLKRLVQHTLLITIPIAWLVFMQYKSGPGSYWNRSFDEDSVAFTVTADIVRTSGTFTFSPGQVAFIGSIIPMLLTAWLIPNKDRPLPRLLLWACTLAVLVNLYVAGSRGAFFAAAFSLTAAMISGLLMRNREQQLRALFLPGMISVLGAVFYVTIFSNAYNAMLERQATASANEGSTLARAAGIVTSLFTSIPRSSFYGVGIGMGSNAGAILAAGHHTFFLSENELPRIIDEAGILGLLYIGFRIWLFGYLALGAMEATKRANNPLPLLLLSFDGVQLLVGQMTLQGTINGYGWLFAGFCLAANEIGKRPVASARAIRARGAPRRLSA